MILNFDDINIGKPDFVIDVGSLLAPAEILQKFKSLNITQYAYAFKVIVRGLPEVYITLKYGRSAKNDCVYGERAERQAANLPGWNQYNSEVYDLPGYGWMPYSPSGKDMMGISMDFRATHGILIDRNNCFIEVWNISNIPQTVVDENYNSIVAENSLLDQYEERYGKLPIGNVRDTRVNSGKNKAQIRLTTLDRIFEEQK